MSPRFCSTTQPLDLEALLLRPAALPSTHAFSLYVQMLPRPKKQRARRRPRSQAATVFAPDTGSLLPQRAIHSPEDLRALINALRLGEYRDDPLHLYLCPWHEVGIPAVQLIPQPGWSTLVHCHRCGYRLTPAELLVRMFGAEKAAVFARSIWPWASPARDFIDVEVVRID